MAKDTAKSLRDRTAEVEAQTRDVAQKIWLAGLGAYGKAYTEAAQNALKLNETTTELFEDLVKRGTEIDGEMKDRISSFEPVQKANENLNKVTETATRMQKEQRERFEARMQRMRAALGFGDTGSKANEISSKIDKLEDEIAELSAKAKPAKGKINKDVATRLARLSSEIDAIAKVNAPAKPKAKAKAKPAARKTAPKKTATTPRKRAVKAKA